MTGRLAGLRIVLDVQHAWRDSHKGDRGSIYRLPGGRTIAEVDLALAYQAGARQRLEELGAAVLVNDPAGRELVGPYSRRASRALSWGAGVYLALHVNAGGGRYTRASVRGGIRGPWPSHDREVALATSITQAIARDNPVVHGAQITTLRLFDRGWVCVGLVSPEIPTVLVEPFFGDNDDHQLLFSPPLLARLGTTIAGAVQAWWEGQKKPLPLGGPQPITSAT